MRYSNPTDARLRLAQRHGDRQAVLLQRLRAGDLRPEQLELAARLGDEDASALAARLGVPSRGAAVVWHDWGRPRSALEECADLYGKRGSRPWQSLLVSFACDCAERVLPLAESLHPGDARSREALDLARRWAQGERITKERLHAATAYATTAANAAYANAAYAYAYANAAAANATNAAATTAYAAANAAYAAAYNATNAAATTAYAAANATRKQEQDWQRLRLAQYALGEV